VKIRGLICNDAVALAIRERRQTEDRRPVSLANPAECILAKRTTHGDRGPRWSFHGPPDEFRPAGASVGRFVESAEAPCQPGDLYYVRECWSPTRAYVAEGVYEDNHPIAYAADYASRHLGTLATGRGWRSSAQMPRWAARTWVRVLDVWPERVQDITEAGARAEGCEAMPPHLTARQSFGVLWDEIYADGPSRWAANPWVWVTRIQRCEEPEVTT
jgi:hypothetical protein